MVNSAIKLLNYYGMQKELRNKIIFIVVFAVIGFGAMQVPFSQLVGASNVKFSLFDFYGPIASGFIGSTLGVVTVALMQLINWGVKGFHTDTATFIRMLPMLFAVFYFAKKTRWLLLVPVISAIVFWAEPNARQAWYFALYWTIPIIAYFFYDRWLLARALGATFTAHSVGGALWSWVFHMPAGLWIGLIPIVWKERLLMAIGIMLTYMAFNYLMSLLQAKTKIHLPFVKLNPKYSVAPKTTL